MLFERLHGTSKAADSEQVMQVYEIFAAALVADQELDDSGWGFGDCRFDQDGFFYEENFTLEEVASFAITVPGQNHYNYDWDVLGPLRQRVISDPLSSKYAWTAVMMYMLSHYDYVHE